MPHAHRPIVHEYAAPDAALIAELKAGDDAVVVDDLPGFIAINRYHQMGLRGSSPRIYARRAVVQRLARALASLGSEYSFMVYDVFRSRETQVHVFETIYADLAARHPEWSHEQLWLRTLDFAAHPEHPGRWGVNPHNTGGAVDLTLACRGIELEMGTAFDEPVAHAATAFFEGEHDPALAIAPDAWLTVRGNRRLLYHAMVDAGFVSNPGEWWHYDLGDPVWAATHGSKWCYASLENEVAALDASRG
jgi:zinc D-Ala-D-Ala dipeptidase